MAGTSENRRFVSRRIGDRILLGALATPIAGLSGWGLMLMVSVAPKPVGVLQGFGQIALGQFVGSVFALSALAFVWAIAAPAWLEQHLERSAGRALIATMLFVPSIFLIAWLI